MRITSKGHVTIPVQFRESTGLLPNTEVRFEFDGKVVKIIPVPVKDGTDRGADVIRYLGGKGEMAMTTDEIMAFTRNS